MNSQNMSEYSVDQDEQFVSKYLRSNPNFFGSNTELLAQIRVPHRTGKAVSLVERQLGVYRDKCQELENTLKEVLMLVSEKEDLNQKLFSLCNEIALCTSLASFERTLKTRLSKDFSIDKIAFHFLDKRISSAITKKTYDESELQIILNKMSEALVICPELNNEQKEGLFGEVSDGIQSSALVCLGENRSCGLLVLGSNDKNIFSPEKGMHALETLRLMLSAKFSNLIK